MPALFKEVYIKDFAESTVGTRIEMFCHEYVGWRVKSDKPFVPPLSLNDTASQQVGSSVEKSRCQPVGHTGDEKVSRSVLRKPLPLRGLLEGQTCCGV